MRRNAQVSDLHFIHHKICKLSFSVSSNKYHSSFTNGSFYFSNVISNYYVFIKIKNNSDIKDFYLKNMNYKINIYINLIL